MVETQLSFQSMGWNSGSDVGNVKATVTSD